MLDKKLLSILVCPVCKGNLYYNKEAQELICPGDALAFPIKDEVPVMLKEEAREMSIEEREKYS
ncbi:MAG: Trm112 family protein [Pseudohongiellaceae bacterium]